MVEWIRRIRNSLGYGVQSPGDFHFVRHVLREESPYYGYAAIGAMHRKYATRVPCYTEAADRLFFRLANHVHPDTIIEVGAGLSTFAMARACPSARCIAMTSSDTCSKAMRPLLSDNPHVEVRRGDEMAVFGQLLREHGRVGLLHVAHTPHYREVVDAALPFVADRTLIIIEGIRDSKERQAWWRELRESSLTGIAYDLRDIGLLFFDRSRHKDTYWITLKD